MADRDEADRPELDHYTHTGPTDPDRAQWPLISIAAMLFLAMGSGGILIGTLLKGQASLESYHLETVNSRIASVEKRQDDFVREVRDMFEKNRAVNVQQAADLSSIRTDIATIKANQANVISSLHDLVQQHQKPQSGEVVPSSKETKAGVLLGANKAGS